MREPALQRLKALLASRPSETVLKEWMAKLSPSEYVTCAVYMSRLGGTTFMRVFSLDHAFKHANKLSDEELFLQLGKAMNDSVQVTDQGVAPVNRRRIPSLPVVSPPCTTKLYAVAFSETTSASA